MNSTPTRKKSRTSSEEKREKERGGGHGRSQDEENSNVRKICNYFINMFCTYFKFSRRGSSGRKFFEYSGTRYVSSNAMHFYFYKRTMGENYPSKIRFLRGKEN